MCRETDGGPLESTEPRENFAIPTPPPSVAPLLNVCSRSQSHSPPPCGVQKEPRSLSKRCLRRISAAMGEDGKMALDVGLGELRGNRKFAASAPKVRPRHLAQKWAGLRRRGPGRGGIGWGGADWAEMDAASRGGAGRNEAGGETQCEMSIITERAEKRGRDQAYSRKRRAGGIICAPANFGFPFICEKRAAPIDRNKPRMKSEGCDVRRDTINPPENGNRRLSSRLATACPAKFKECA